MIPQVYVPAGISRETYVNYSFIAYKGEPFVNSTVRPNLFYLIYGGPTASIDVGSFTSLKFNEKSITWYGNTDDYQLNRTANIYYYIAIGQ